MPPQRRATDVDLAGGFRLDLKTGVLLAALAAQWWDGRSQAREDRNLQALRDQHATERLAEFSGQLEAITAYLSNLKASLAAAGVADVEGKPIRRTP